MRNKYLFSLLFMRLNSSRFRFVYAASLLFSLSLCHFCVFEFCCMVVCAMCPMCRGCVFVARAKRASDMERVRESERDGMMSFVHCCAYNSQPQQIWFSRSGILCPYGHTDTRTHARTHTQHKRLLLLLLLLLSTSNDPNCCWECIAQKVDVCIYLWVWFKLYA